MRELLKLIILGTSVLGVENSMIAISGFNLPEIDDWWGTEESKVDCDTGVRPFKVKFEEEMIIDLKQRLTNHRSFTPPLKDAAFHYGFNTDNMDSWIDYWAHDYNFTEREEFMNQFPHFKTNIQGLDLHFIRVKPADVPEDVEVLPLMLLHGWPGSVREFYSAIPLLTAYCQQRGFAIEVIVPSLPGFGFSGAAVRKGLGSTEMAVVLRNLMHRLGFKKFYIQGGDWGAHICNSISTFFPDEVLGYHTNYAVSFAPGTLATWFFGSLSKELQSLVVDPSLADRLYPISAILKSLVTETGYLLQATKPDTIGVAMSDSPSGLLAYILQIVSMATRPDYIDRDDGGLYELYPREELIDNLMVYWVNNAFTTAVRIYAETLNIRNVEMKSFALSTPVPTCTVHAKSELLYQSPSMLQFKYTNHVNATVLEDGGHFLAMEKPDFFSDNVLSCIEMVRKWHAKRACKEEL